VLCSASEKMRCVALIALLVLAFASYAAAENYAVIVAGSNEYFNYRHQTDCCHAFQVLVKNGVNKENIITMLFDDLANDPENPFPGKLFNKPTADGVPGVDVYGGCQVDYSGNDVTAANFLAIITGNKSAMAGVGSGKVLESSDNDNVFINFVDHGATGLVAFPVGPYLYADDLSAALTQMHSTKMYKKLVFYLESCESGSMFDGLLPPSYSIYATTASGPDESSWGTYCPPDDLVDGTELNTCLGDLYSVNWMEDADTQTSKGMDETLQQQFVVVRNETNLSKVMQYGDLTYTSERIGDFEGEERATRLRPHLRHHDATPKRKSTSNVPSYDVKMHSLYYKYLRTPTIETQRRQAAMQALQSELQHRVFTDLLFRTIARSVVREEAVEMLLFASPARPARCDGCCRQLTETLRASCGQFSDYGMQYMRTVLNVCRAAERSNVAFDTILHGVRDFCSMHQHARLF